MAIGWLLFVAFLVVVGQSWVYKRYSLRGLSVSRTFSEQAVTEGDEVEMVERIANRKPLPLPWIKLESAIHAHLRFRKQFHVDISGGELFQNHSSVFSLMPYKQITRRHQIRCMRRGYYQLNTATLTCGDVLGLQSGHVTLPLKAELTVYPKLLPLDDPALPSRSWLGDVLVKRWIMEDPFVVTGVRGYRDGDSLKDVNWKATARTGELQVHQKGFTADTAIRLVLNFEVEETMRQVVSDPELIERGISLAATLAAYACEQGAEVGFGCNGRAFHTEDLFVRVEPAAGYEHLQVLNETMARLVLVSGQSMADYLEEELHLAGRQSVYVFLTPYLNDRLHSALQRLEAAGHAVETILLEHAPAEELDPDMAAEAERMKAAGWDSPDSGTVPSGAAPAAGADMFRSGGGLAAAGTAGAGTERRKAHG
ncbi:hypothetical protein J31TS4_36650 [Paenibacillus sp. J31TS4]|uniref:DUF58 domain-containing protein n=1 Tax=Paenibacillus sp. J31TS4 TaxID=2807195 RepID=UPI001B080EFF|nr:DUF58 domain-containing protein [Paenibacillus sp. J31TS4]GIP40385.1 hypothetical protein J31TS4_36650 [Paenibacillus sp. J31TS4]